jgi:hypothetical protein
VAHRLLAQRLSVVALVVLLFPSASAASTDGLVKLLDVLKARGTISAAEYAEIMRAVDGSAETAEPFATCQASTAHAETRSSEAEPDSTEPRAEAPATLSLPVTSPEGQSTTRPDVPAQAPAASDSNAWYRRFTLRGYTQMRFTQNVDDPVEVPADRSVNDNETFIIRRGRLVLSGDVSDRVSLYTQSDLQASTGATDFSLQLRDMYADVWLDRAKTFRVRLGQQKIPYGWVNMQSSQNRAGLERPEGINSAAETERDIGAFLMWGSTAAKANFRELQNARLKGSGDYGVVAVGLYGGQGPNRTDQNGAPHFLARASYPFKLASGQFFEVGVQGYSGRFVAPTQAITVGGTSVTPRNPSDGVLDQRFGVNAIWYPQPIGIEAEWNVGRGPELSSDFLSIGRGSLNGGYLQVGYREGFAFPFARWNYYDGARKFARNAPRMEVNEVDFGLEVAKWAELEATIVYTHTLRRTRTSTFPYSLQRDGNRVGFQVQWNY